MKTLIAAIDKLLLAFGRDGKDYGSIEKQEKSSFLIDRYVPLSGQILEFYDSIDFDEFSVGGTLHLDIYPSEALKEAQVGWRWLRNKNGDLVEDNSWNKNWVVIGDRLGDGIFVKTDDVLSPTFGTIQGEDFYQLGLSFASFLGVLSDCLIMEQLEFNFDTRLEDSSVKQEFISRVRQIVTKSEGIEVAEEFINFFFS